METLQSNLNGDKYTQTNGNINIENHGVVLVARIDGGPDFK